jgi:hypothetical protein
VQKIVRKLPLSSVAAAAAGAADRPVCKSSFRMKKEEEEVIMQTKQSSHNFMTPSPPTPTLHTTCNAKSNFPAKDKLPASSILSPALSINHSMYLVTYAEEISAVNSGVFQNI